MADNVYRIPGQPAPAEQVAPQPATAAAGVHPFAISPEEGLPLIPQEALLQKLQKLVALKHGAVTMYASYADALRAPFRDALYAHFEEHAKEERTSIYDFNMKIVALGGSVSTKTVRAPEAAGVQDILTAIIQFEKQLLEAQRELLRVCGEYDGLRLLLEEHILTDQRHLDDARRMLVTLP